VIGQADRDRKYEIGERAIPQQEVDRIQTLQDLHAAISLAVIMLVTGLFACMIFPFLGYYPDASPANPQPARILAPWERELALVLTYVLFVVGISTALTFLDIAKAFSKPSRVMRNHSNAAF
jgi:hypothetical protein